MNWLQFANIFNLALCTILILIAAGTLCDAAREAWKASAQEARNAISAVARRTWKNVHVLELSIYASPVVFAFSLFLSIEFRKDWSPEHQKDWPREQPIVIIRSGLFWQALLEALQEYKLARETWLEGKRILGGLLLLFSLALSCVLFALSFALDWIFLFSLSVAIGYLLTLGWAVAFLCHTNQRRPRILFAFEVLRSLINIATVLAVAACPKQNEDRLPYNTVQALIINLLFLARPCIKLSRLPSCLQLLWQRITPPKKQKIRSPQGNSVHSLKQEPSSEQKSAAPQKHLDSLRSSGRASLHTYTSRDALLPEDELMTVPNSKSYRHDTEACAVYYPEPVYPRRASPAADEKMYDSQLEVRPPFTLWETITTIDRPMTPDSDQLDFDHASMGQGHSRLPYRPEYGRRPARLRYKA